MTPEDFPKIIVYGRDFRPDLCNMYQAITELDLWDTLRNEKPDSYMFSDLPFIDRILSHPKVDGRHSGATAAYCLRVMEYIADHGFDEYVNNLSKT